MLLIALEVPIDPDADTAREWAKDELAKDVYSTDGSSWLRDLMRWLNELFQQQPGGNGLNLPDLNLGAIVAIVLAAGFLAALVFLWLRRGKRVRMAKRSPSVFDDDARDVAELRDAARLAAAQGDWTLAVIERFRAIVKHLEERGHVVVFPGMTAHECATSASERLPALIVELHWAADLFDALRYGHAVGTASQYDRVTALEASASAVRAASVTP